MSLKDLFLVESVVLLLRRWGQMAVFNYKYLILEVIFENKHKGKT